MGDEACRGVSGWRELAAAIVDDEAVHAFWRVLSSRFLVALLERPVALEVVSVPRTGVRECAFRRLHLRYTRDCERWRWV